MKETEQFIKDIGRNVDYAFDRGAEIERKRILLLSDSVECSAQDNAIWVQQIIKQKIMENAE